jgi:hypothetical protein
MASLVPAEQSAERELHRLRAHAGALQAALAERRAEVARAEAELTAFGARYRHDVGRLHEQLDEIDAAIAEAELGEIDRRLREEGAPRQSPPAAPPASAPRFTSDAVRRLFRDVAKAIHPDLAIDESGRDRRHALMIEANQAYAVGDAERLRAILQTWERRPEAVQSPDPAAERVRLLARIAEIEEQLAAGAAALAACHDSPLWKLKVMVDEASANGKDLVADMVRRLKRDILVATNRLDAMRSSPPRARVRPQG